MLVSEASFECEISCSFAGLLCCAGGGTRTHTRLPSPDFESDKDCGIVRVAALRGAFMSFFAFLCGIERDQVRPDCHQSCHQDSGSMKEGPGLLETRLSVDLPTHREIRGNL